MQDFLLIFILANSNLLFFKLLLTDMSIVYEPIGKRCFIVMPKVKPMINNEITRFGFVYEKTRYCIGFLPGQSANSNFLKGIETTRITKGEGQLRKLPLSFHVHRKSQFSPLLHTIAECFFIRICSFLNRIGQPHAFIFSFSQ